MNKIIAVRIERKEKPWEIFKVIAWKRWTDSIRELRDVSNYPESYIHRGMDPDT